MQAQPCALPASALFNALFLSHSPALSKVPVELLLTSYVGPTLITANQD